MDKDKKKRPVTAPIRVAQTKTSYYRMIKANPTLLVNNSVSLPEKVKLPKAVTASISTSLIDKSLLAPTPKKKDFTVNIAPVIASKPSATSKRYDLIKPRYAVSNTDNFKHPASIKQVPATKQNRDANSRSKLKAPEPPRRSLSAQYFNRKQHMDRPNLTTLNDTKSMENLHEITVNKSVRFNDATPPNSFKPQNVRSSTPGPTRAVLQERLYNWLKKRGKLATCNYQNISNFAKHGKLCDKTRSESKKENTLPVENDNITFEEMKEETKTMHNVTVQDVLNELCNLIKEGFDLEQCEMWLSSVKNKYPTVDEKPEYWECRAAIEEARGNIATAVECYKTAIVQGAEVTKVDHQFDELFEKFTALGIEPDKKKSTSTKSKRNPLQEFQNVFKSTVIKIAVQERKNKKAKDDIYTVATPVRRSTRTSRSTFVSTPGVKLYDSLRETEETNIQFQNNSYLA